MILPLAIVSISVYLESSYSSLFSSSPLSSLPPSLIFLHLSLTYLHLPSFIPLSSLPIISSHQPPSPPPLILPLFLPLHICLFCFQVFIIIWIENLPTPPSGTKVNKVGQQRGQIASRLKPGANQRER